LKADFSILSSCGITRRLQDDKEQLEKSEVLLQHRCGLARGQAGVVADLFLQDQLDAALSSFFVLEGQLLGLNLSDPFL